MEIVLKNLGKQYGKENWGVQDLNFKIGPGVLGLLGPNGAGKSTLMSVIATITRPTCGQVVWNGVNLEDNPNRLRNVLGYLPQDFGVYPHLTAVEFLEYMAALKNLSPSESRTKINQLLDLVNLSDARSRRLGEFSGGMKQRIGIAQALLNDPQVLIVDEPTAGLDPQERVRFRNLLSDLAGERIIILSTHIVPDVEAVATDIAVINAGRLIKHALPEDMLEMVEGKVWEVIISSDELIDLRKEALVGSVVHRSNGIQARIITEKPAHKQAKIQEPTLEDAYLFCIQQNGRTI